jgi:hypothetical protein
MCLIFLSHYFYTLWDKKLSAHKHVKPTEKESSNQKLLDTKIGIYYNYKTETWFK